MTAKKSQKKAAAKAPRAAENDPLLADLNAEQRQAVVHGSGPLLIVAGAGTGKTMAISRRIAWLVQTARAKPEEILALTFTDKAAGEMVERVDALLPLGYTDLWISTFHAFCQRLLHEHALEIGLPDDFRLLNETDAYLLVRRNLDKFDLDYYRPLGNPAKFIHALLSHFSRAKDENVSPEEYLEFVKNAKLDQDLAAETEERGRLTEIANAYHVYQKLLLDNGCLDLGDLLLYTLRLLTTRRRVLDKYRVQFKQVIVDEFQDTNWAQYELLKLLVPKRGNIVVVGDDDQSIYKFRGASVANILQFKDDFPGAAEILLTRNYRSCQNILDRAHEFIKRNDPNRLEARLGAAASKRLVADRPGLAPIEHLHFATAEDEVAGVADRIMEIKNGLQDGQWSDFCILARSNSSADAFSYELQRRGIPYQFLALKGLYSKPVVLDCLAYFKLLDNYHESPALYRVLSSPPYRIDGEDLVNLTHQARRKAESLYETLKKQELLRLKPETSRTIDRLLGHLAAHSRLVGQKSVSEMLVRFLYDSGYTAELKRDDTAEARERSSHLNQFLARLRRFEAGHDEPTLRHFMEEFAIERDSGDEGSLSFDVETGPDMVRLMTVHAAKGLEFPYVFVVNLVDKRFPSIERGGGIELPDALAKEKIPEGDMHLEEERRLFYVAMTRAKDGLFFTSAEDYGGKTKKKPSRFIAELGFEPAPAAAPSVEKLPDIPAAQTPSVAPALAPPNYFSFTQLAAYAKCPLQYKYAHVLKLPLFGKGHFSFGKTIHSTLQKFMEEYAERRGMGQQQLFGAAPADQDAVPVSREELEKMYEAAWIDDWYPSAQIKEDYRRKGRAILDSFYKRVTDLHPEPLFLEKDFKVRLGSYWVRGKIDRIDKLPGGEVEIIDYKTGQSKGETKVKPEDKRQLMLYQIAAGRLLGLKPGRLTYEYLEDGTKVSFLAKDDELVSFEEDVSAEIDRIRGGDYTPTPGRHCDFCDFADICEFRQ